VNQALAEHLKDACQKSEVISCIEPLLCLSPSQVNTVWFIIFRVVTDLGKSLESPGI